MKTKAILGGFVLTLLIAVLGAGLFYVRQQQDVRSKASQFGSGWPINPTPADGKIDVDLSPNFSWEYETPQYPNCNPAGSYANLYLWDCAAHDDSCLIAFGTKSSDTASIYNIDGASVHPYLSPGKPDYSRSIMPLQPNKQYWWYVTPKACGVLHFEEKKAWTFTTKTAVAPGCNSTCGSNADCPADMVCSGSNCRNPACLAETNCICKAFTCDSITMTPNDAKISAAAETRQLTANVSGGEGKITYLWTAVTDQASGSFSEAGVKTVTWKAPNLLLGNQMWQIKVEAKDATGKIASGSGCTKTLSYTLPGEAACQKVEADKDLSKLKIGDQVTFTGWGSITTDPATDAIDNINFIVLRDGQEVANKMASPTRAADKDNGFVRYWKGTLPFKIEAGGNYSVKIRVHWKNRNIWLE